MMTTASTWKMDLSGLEFYTESDCTEDSFIDPSTGTAIESGSVYNDPTGDWSAYNMFNNGGLWGGRTDENGDFYIGLTFSEDKDVKCIKMTQPSEGAIANEITIQSRATEDSAWSDVTFASDLTTGTNTIEVHCGLTSGPLPAPTLMPNAGLLDLTPIPTNAPTSRSFYTPTALHEPSFVPTS